MWSQQKWWALWHVGMHHVDCSSSFSNLKCPNIHSISISDNNKNWKNVCNFITVSISIKQQKKKNICLIIMEKKNEKRTENMIKHFLPQCLSCGLCWWAELRKSYYDHFSPDPVSTSELNSWVCNKYMNMNTLNLMMFLQRCCWQWDFASRNKHIYFRAYITGT